MNTILGIALGLACAVSYVRFLLELHRRRERPRPPGLTIVIIYWRACCRLMGHRKRESFYTCRLTVPPYQNLGVWRGIGDFTYFI